MSVDITRAPYREKWELWQYGQLWLTPWLTIWLNHTPKTWLNHGIFIMVQPHGQPWLTMVDHG